MTQPTPSPDDLPSLGKCPVCDGCDHDFRAGLLEFIANVRDNVTAAAELLLDGIEKDTHDPALFLRSIATANTVRRQMQAFAEVAATTAAIKEMQ